MYDEQLKPGDKVAPGKVVGKDGTIQDSSSKKLVKAGQNIGELYIEYKTGGMGKNGGPNAPTGGPTGTPTPTVGGPDLGPTAKEQLLEKNAPGPTAKEQLLEKNAPGPTAKEQLLARNAPGPSAKEQFLKKYGHKTVEKNTMAPGSPVHDRLNPKQVIGKVVDDAENKIADKMDENPALKKAADELEDAADTVNNAADAYKKAKSGDIKGAKDSAKKAAKSLKSVAKKGIKKVIKIIAVSILLPIFLFIIIPVICILPFVAGLKELVNLAEDAWDNITSALSGDSDGGGDVPTATQTNINEIDKAVISGIPNYESLSLSRQTFLKSAVVAIGSIYTPNLEPTSYDLTGLNGGVDGFGYFQWMVWNASYTNIGHYTASNLYDSGYFEAVYEVSILPGDIGVIEDTNEVAIYMGNYQWIRADINESGTSGTFSLCTIYDTTFQYFYRFKNMDVDVNAEPTVNTEG